MLVAMLSSRSRRVLANIGIALVYVAAAKFGLTMAVVAEQVTVVWPPTGIAFAAILLIGYGVWPGVFAGAFIANVTSHEPIGTAAAIAFGNAIEAVVAVYVLQRFLGFKPALNRVRDVAGLIVASSVFSTAISATIGVASLCASGLQPWQRFGELWWVWWLGDALGSLTVAPLLLTLASRLPSGRKQLSAEFVSLTAGLGVTCMIVFGGLWIPQKPQPLEYVVFPFVIWAALRFGPPGTARVIFLSAVIAVWGTSKGLGPLASGSAGENLIFLQMFMAVVSVTGLMLAAAISEAREKHALLQTAEERYRSLVLATSQVVWRTNASGDVVDDLPTWTAFTGQTREDLQGRGWINMLHPDDVQRVGAIWEGSLRAGTPHETEFRVRARDGQYKHVYSRAIPVLEIDGTIREWVGTLTDITERKLIEEQRLELYHLADENNRIKDEFFAMLAHELRNPLSAIRTGLEVSRLAADDTVQNRTREIINRQVNHLTRLTDDLLDVSRVTRGKIELRNTAVDLRDVVRSSIDAVRSSIDSRQHRLSVRVPDSPIVVSGDSTRLEQVLINLIQNAAKYTNPGGSIEIELRQVHNEAVLSVKDDGIGISPELLPRVFELFRQAERSLARSEGGLGIGLTIARNLVSMHGGSIEARSAGLGQGSEFVVRLPVCSSTQQADANPAATVMPGGGLRIIVVDDNVDSAEVLTLMLTLDGHKVRTYSSGREALIAVSEFKPHVLLLDIGLPSMDGYEVASLVRQLDPARKIQLIAITGYGQNDDQLRAAEAGFDHFLMKPVSRDALARLLRAREHSNREYSRGQSG
jgi:two-component system CheB/CheR fusion protein